LESGTLKLENILIKKILFVTYGGGHSKLILPIVKQLQALAQYEVISLALTTAANDFSKENIDFKGFKDILPFYSIQEQNSCITYGKKLAEKNGAVNYDESIAYLGISYFELVKEYGEEEAQKLYENKGRAAFLPTNALFKFMSAIEPSLLVTTVSPRAEEASILAAKKLNIPSICINDFINKNSANRISRIEPDITCVINENVKKQLAKLNSTLDIRVTGNPAFDRLALSTIDKKTVKKQLNIKGPVVLWAAQREHSVHPFTNKKGDVKLPRKVESALYDIAKSSDVNFIFRSHPNYPVDYSIYNSYVIDGNLYSLDELLHIADIVITISSTVGYEGLILGKKLITIEGSTLNDDGPYHELNMSEGVNDLADLRSVIETLIADENKLQVEVGGFNGDAANKIVKLIKCVINE